MYFGMLIDLLAYRRLETMRMEEHLILLGETMMILMSISGKLYSQGCRTPTSAIFSLTLPLLCRSRHCFKLGWPWRKILPSSCIQHPQRFGIFFWYRYVCYIVIFHLYKISLEVYLYHFAGYNMKMKSFMCTI